MNHCRVVFESLPVRQSVTEGEPHSTAELVPKAARENPVSSQQVLQQRSHTLPHFTKRCLVRQCH